MFIASRVTDGILDGVEYEDGCAIVNSIIMDSKEGVKNIINRIYIS